MGDEERAERTVKKGWEREGEKYYGWGDGEGVGKLSSEDIWEARRWKVRGAFGGEWEGVGRGLGMEKGEGRDMGMGVGGGKDEDGSG